MRVISFRNHTVEVGAIVIRMSRKVQKPKGRLVFSTLVSGVFFNDLRKYGLGLHAGFRFLRKHC